MKGEPCNQCMRKLFCSRFIIPNISFLELTHDISKHELFQSWSSKDCTGQESGNIKLLILGPLRYLGRGWTFDDIEGSTAISREVNRVFLSVFRTYGSTILFHNHVTLTVHNCDPREFEHLFAITDYSGFLVSLDATHVGMLKCASWETICHLDNK